MGRVRHIHSLEQRLNKCFLNSHFQRHNSPRHSDPAGGPVFKNPTEDDAVSSIQHLPCTCASSHLKAGATAARVAISSAPTSLHWAPDRMEFLNPLLQSSQLSAGVAASNTPMQGSRSSAARRPSPWNLTLGGGDDSMQAAGCHLPFQLRGGRVLGSRR